MNIFLKILIPVLLISCNKPKECFQPEVDLKYDIFPRKEAFKIGDSLVFKAEIDRVTTDVDDGRFVNTFDFKLFSGAIGIKGFSDNKEHYAAWSYFTFKVLRGTEKVTNQNSTVRRFEFTKTDSSYVFEVMIYPRKKGIFVLNTPEIRGENGRCNILFGYPKPLFNYGNYHIYENFMRIGLDELSKTQAYFFEVN